jgi:hypothetical protein
MSKYEDVLRDYEYLESIGLADDLTGGYVDGDAYRELLNNPTKANAKKHLCALIDYWFSVGIEPDSGFKGSYEDACNEYPRLEEIRQEYAPNQTNPWLGS